MDGLLKLFNLDRGDPPMILLCAALFVVLWRVLERRLFTPYLAFLERREALTIGARDRIDAVESEALALETKYDDAVNRARVSAMEDKFSRVGAAKKEVDDLLADAQAKAESVIESARREIEQGRSQVRFDSWGDTRNLVRMVVDRVSGSPSN